MATNTKNKYKEEHDKVILEALKKSPDNRNEAFRIAEKELKEKFGMETNPNQISSRFYTYIKPKILDRDDSEEIKNNLVTSAGNSVSSDRSKQYYIVKEIVMRLSPDDRMHLAKEILFDLL